MATSTANGRTNTFDIIGSSGLERFSGYVFEPYLRVLRGSQGRGILREMSEQDPVVGSVLYALELLIRGIEWRMEPASEDNIDLEIAEFAEQCMNDMSVSWADFISEVVTMLIYGWAYHEIVYKKRTGDSRDPKKRSKFSDGRIGWRKLPLRSQNTLETWEFDEEGGIRGMNQQAPPVYETVFIPIERSLLFRTTARLNNPEGRSVLLNAYRPWYFKKQIEQIEAIGVERDLAGLPVGYIPAEYLMNDANAKQVAAREIYRQILINIRRDEQEGILWPSDRDPNTGERLYDLQLLSTGGQRQFNTDAIISRNDQRIAMTSLADFILLGHENVGSKALSVSKTDLFTQSLQAFADGIASIMNQHAYPRLFKLNGINADAYPMLVAEQVQQVDLTELGEYISKLAGAGMLLFPDEQLEQHIRSVANLPEKVEDQL